MSFLWIIIIVIVVWYFIKESKKSESQSPASSSEQEENKERKFTEDAVFSIQTKFEKQLEETYLPDAISGKEIYLYQNLIRPWYNELTSKNRYDDNMTQKLRLDFIEYMDSLKDRSTYNFLSLESEGKESEKYREMHINASRKVFAIQDAFAAAIGTKAIDELARVRNESSFRKFSNSGQMAPKGFVFDLEDKLQPKKEDKRKTTKD